MESQKLRVDLQDVMQGRLLIQVSLAGVFQGLGHCSLPCLEKGEEYISPPQASHLLVPGSDMPVTKGSLVLFHSLSSSPQPVAVAGTGSRHS